MPTFRSFLSPALFLLAGLPLLHGQETPTAASRISASPGTGGAVAPVRGGAPTAALGTTRSAEPAPAEPAPTWETQKNARTYLLAIPAPRGQITDRNGNPLAQSRVSYNLAVQFPTPPNFSTVQALNYAQRKAFQAQTVIGRQIVVSGALTEKHYKNRAVIPMVIAQDLSPAELEAFNASKPDGLVLQPVYQRFYPNGQMAGHIVGYAGRSGKIPDGPIENNELLWPDAAGREGLEQTFNDQLQGKVGQYNISFDASGRRTSEQVSIPPQPGYNVVTTLDENMQRLCEQTLDKGAKRGAIAIIDPNNGDVLALASWPSINPNSFVPSISEAEFKRLQEDPDIPLLPRAFRSAYPPGSVFKCFVGLAGINSDKIGRHDEFSCPPALEIGNLTFRNWKKTHGGSLDFADALTQSCNTWFYQAGQKIGSAIMSDYALRLGLGEKTGIPLAAEAEGRIPTDEYMQKVYKRKMMPGDIANFSIGQGDLLISPLQMAQAMAAIGNGGTLYQTRLVKQVQSIDGQIVTAYDVRARAQLDYSEEALSTLRRGMVQVVSSRMGTAGKAAVPGFKVAGKTGTAQWGPKNRERTAAWFAGFVPAEEPKYAFAAVYEGEANNDDVHGGTQAAPLIGKVMRELFKNEPRSTGKSKKRSEDGEEMAAEEGEEDEEMEVRPRRKPRVQEAAPTPPPRPRPEKLPFWRRLFM